MPYRENVPPLDFTGIHTATISGDNGAGKSAIIDAITWALWDKSRAKKEDDLIHAGQNEAQVEFEFAVGGQKYRVVRKRARPKRPGGAGATQLHLFIDGEAGERPIDGDTITQTQQKIEEILHMDYGTFTNSAYLRQGHADEFTTATPGDRKKVLGNILGLEVYEALERRARDLATHRKIAKDQLQNSLGEIDTELLQLPGYETEMVKTEAELSVIEAALKIIEANLGGLRSKKELLETKKARVAHIEQTLKANRQHLVQLQAQISQLQMRIKEHEATLAKRDEIEAGYAKFADALNRVDIYNKNLTIYSHLTQKQNEMEKIIEREKQALLTQFELAQNNVNQLKKVSQELPRLREGLKQSQALLVQIGQKEELLKQSKQDGQELLAVIRSLESDKTRHEGEITEINEKLHLLKSQTGAAKCPMCGCDLGANGIEHIANEYENEKIKKSEMIKANLAEIKSKKTELKTTSEESGLLERTLALEKGKLQNRQGGLEKEIVRAEEAGKLLDEESVKQKEIEERLSAKDFAVAQQGALRLLEAEIAKLDYDPQKLQQAQALLGDLKPFESARSKLEESERLITQEKESLDGLTKMAMQLGDALRTDEQQKSVLSQEILALDPIITELAKNETELKDLTAQQLRSRQQYGSIKQRIIDLQQLTLKRKERAELLDSTAKEEQVYRDLAEAFSKKGVQGLLIETAIPEIENKANELLSRMTDGRMNVKFETQGATQKGEPTETLDIKISDELGTRNYEMYSGGEAFRVNFAIRIALSRLLANRAGAPLPTLIIDEGFGTQDASGIEKLKEAIVSIQDDFEKILVITHIDELKDAFPARIEVTKTPEGSMISLS